jgi:hypothetical protein
MKYQPKAEIRDGKKQCRLCLEWIDISLFGTFLEKKNKVPTRYINSRCKKCASKVSCDWGKKNRPRLTQKWLVDKENMLKQIRDGYGGKCNCCGESNPLFLTIDHVNNDGYKIRPRNKKGNYGSPFSGHYYKQIIKAGFPKDLQLLCWNCNCGKARNKGVCPHKTTI